MDKYQLPECYEVTRSGSVISHKPWRGESSRELAIEINQDGYPCVRVIVQGKKKRVPIHGLVARTFLKPPSFERGEVWHIDGDKTNAQADNLVWVRRLSHSKDDELTVDVVRQILQYCPVTGVFHRVLSSGFGVVVGPKMGSIDRHGYLRIGIGSKRYFAHRLAWLVTHGAWPADLIDHINGVRDDNRIANLRTVTPTGNSQNLRASRPSNKSGLLGAIAHKPTGKWKAQIKHGGKCFFLGLFDLPEEAHAAYVAKKRELHEACTL